MATGGPGAVHNASLARPAAANEPREPAWEGRARKRRHTALSWKAMKLVDQLPSPAARIAGGGWTRTLFTVCGVDGKPGT